MFRVSLARTLRPFTSGSGLPTLWRELSDPASLMDNRSDKCYTQVAVAFYEYHAHCPYWRALIAFDDAQTR
jgi:hypothetical protein